MASARRRRRRRPGCALGSARLGWGRRRRPSALCRAAPRCEARARAAAAAVAAAAAAVDVAVLPLLLEGGSAGLPECPPSADLPLSCTLPPPLPTPGVPSEPPAPIQPVTALSSGSRCWGRRLWRQRGAAGGSGGPAAICGPGGESQAARLLTAPAFCLPPGQASEAPAPTPTPTPGGRARCGRLRGPAKDTGLRKPTRTQANCRSAGARTRDPAPPPSSAQSWSRAPSPNSKRAISPGTRRCLCPSGTEKGRGKLVERREIKFHRQPSDSHLEE